MHTYYHGTNQPDAVIEAIIGAGRIHTPFHMTHDPDIAKNYGNHVVRIEVEEDIPSARVSRINKIGSFAERGNYNAAVGDAVETVIAEPRAVNEFYYSIHNAEIA